jgi:hypothetical protein
MTTLMDFWCRFSEVQYDTVNTILDRSLHGQVEVLEQLEHVSVLVEDERDEFANTHPSRTGDELLEKQRTRAAMLILIDDRESQFRTVGGGGDPNKASDGDESLAAFFLDRYGQGDVIAKIEFRNHA